MNLLVNTNPFCELCLAIPKLWEAMQKQDRDSAFRPGLHDLQTDAICFYSAVFQIHGELFFRLRAIVTDKDF
jgi:hypothetical protein